MPTVIDPDGRIFPATRNAHTIVATLRNYCLAHGVTFRYRSQVSAICVKEGHVTGVAVGSKTIAAGAVILATGGASYPATGSTGDGYALARALGHTITPLWPGLVGLVASDAWIPSVTGVALQDVCLRAVQRGQVLKTMRGDMLFTRDGLSGPAILNLSLYISSAFARGAVLLQADLAPDTSEEHLDGLITAEMRTQGGQKVGRLLHRWFPHSMVPIGAQLVGIPPERRLAEISASERQRIASLIKGLPIHLVATRPMAEAMVTIGGIALEEVDPYTMASRLVGGLYFAGEVLDIAGETGGYNLQVAFASGWVAGSSVHC
jgi:predicted Rossmann fold flavoprotein